MLLLVIAPTPQGTLNKPSKWIVRDYIYVCTYVVVCTVPLESYDRVPRARTRVHARVSVNNIV